MDDLGIDQEQAECLSESLSDTFWTSLHPGLVNWRIMEDLQELFEAFIGCGV